MAENSKIEWCNHTFNPWRGCSKISPGCEHCYAETLSKRNPKLLGEWGKGKPRVLASDEMWKQPVKWDKHAKESRVIGGDVLHQWGSAQNVGHPETLVIMASDSKGFTHEIKPEEWAAAEQPRPRVFCASLADWLDDEVPIEWLIRLLSLIVATPNLDWLLLTKRLENLRPRMEQVMRAIPRNNITGAESSARCLAEAWLTTGGTIIHNIWLGTTVEDQTRADERIPLLLSIPAKVRFLSCEPLLGPVDLHSPHIKVETWRVGEYFDGPPPLNGIHWVICGGESGPKARPMHPDWARSLRDQCADAGAGVPFFFKQWGEYTYSSQNEGHYDTSAGHLVRVGKAKASRLLDGIEHNGFPKMEGRNAR